MYCPPFLALGAILISINRELGALQTYSTSVELNGFIQVLKLIEGSYPGSREISHQM